MSEQTKKGTLSAEAIRHAKEKRELLRQIEEMKAQQEQALATTKEASASINSVGDGVVEALQAQINELKKAIETPRREVSATAALAERFRPVTPADLADEEVTFVAGNVLYLISSYLDGNGIEHYAPHKSIMFQYAASDIKKDGNEQTIKNFCQYNTKLKSEIDFLRNHPYYGIKFYDNLNAMMGEKAIDVDFRVQAAASIQHLAPEAVMERAKEFKVFNPKLSAAEMRPLVIDKLAQAYRDNHDSEARERLKRNILSKNSKL